MLVPWAGRGRGPPDRSTCAGSPTRAAPILLPEAEVDRLGAVIDGLRADPAALAAMAAAAAAAGAQHRGGRLVDVIEDVAAGRP